VHFQLLRSSCVLFLLAATTGCQAAAPRAGETVSPGVTPTAQLYDPVTMDPLVRDSAYPPRMVELALESSGERLNAILYTAAGRGPHPVVVLLHGNPGNERNLDLAQAIRRAGYMVLFFNYRGSWGSGGRFSRSHALEDVHAALRWVRSGATTARFRTDSGRIVLVGHSMGGWLALMAAAEDPRVACVGALDSRNVGAYGRALRRDRAADSALVVATDSLTAPGAPYRTEGGGAELVAEMKANAEGWDVTAHARALGGRPILLVSAMFKADQDSLVAALDRVEARRVTALAWRTDHSFSDRRLALARTVVAWLRSSCTL
jgi:pimeloyl-ACP methyl ester carboxylesterase